MVGRSILQQREPSTAQQFYLDMLAWAQQSSEDVHDAQAAFDTWYAAGLLDRVDYLQEGSAKLRLTLPADMQLSEIRTFCLDHLCRRIVKMPELLLILEQIAHPTLSTVQRVLFGGERAGFDVMARLTLLAAFEAVHRNGDEWQLAAPGKAALEVNPPQELPDYGELATVDDLDDSPIELEWEVDLGLLDI